MNTTIRYLCDEHVQRALLAALAGKEPGMEILAIGQEDAPPKATPDREVLLWAEQHGYTLLTQDKKTMPGHAAAHLAAGHHTWGVLLLREHETWNDILESLLAIWSASQAEEWRDQIDWIPM